MPADIAARPLMTPRAPAGSGVKPVIDTSRAHGGAAGKPLHSLRQEKW